ncbi:hypothetical protein PHSY_005576 [Pseudozyma hubeiensis SY62]|uniref:RFX-type winged-helix domain-containing protein n=1 Tax=Pseudozyma hubeiensis (strain SY62) TaxID=1305764 RepID=R9P9C0_PSEHS|nr:hypothetical protein PHSY_005576 [Pseudozyma hubeiensis SY62]GAC97988.1 hypothetical protein PHSY_005576 [Pseudozyma hubeiensis SY62]
MHPMPSLTHRPQSTPGKPHTPSSMLQHHPSSTRLPHTSSDASAPFKRFKMVGDGFEAPYLLPGPSNRILLSLKSGLPSQIDWALSRLTSLTSGHRDQAARDFTLDSVPGLTEALLSYVRRIHAALTGQHPSKWAACYFEQPVDCPDVGIGAPGDGGHQGLSTSRQLYIKQLQYVSIMHMESKSVPSTASDDGADASHAVLMRRALEAALSLRNLTMHGSNARSLASTKGIFGLIRDVLRLPVTAMQTRKHTEIASESQHEDGWFEVEGIAELRLYFLDILETLAARVSLTKRAAAVDSTVKGLTLINGKRDAADKAEGAKHEAALLGDDIFETLLSLALRSNDRAMLLGSLRCLTTVAANERNEVAFTEVTLANGQQSPGLLHRCVELLPLTQDTELLDAALDLLYQLICIGNNAIKIAASLDPETRRASSPSSRRASGLNTKTYPSKSTHATAKTAALVRLLCRNLQLGRTMWERLVPLRVPNAWLSSIPSRHIETMRKRRELQIRIANETPQERARRKKLTPQESQSLLGLKEPERGIAWMKMVFQLDQTQEITQMEFWTAYKEEFGQQTDVPLQPAAELIRAVSQVFPHAAAMVVPPQDGKPQRFVIRGITVKERDTELLEPFRCHWSTCSAPQTNTLESQRSHAKLHAEYASDGRCRWRRCDFDAKSSDAAIEAVDAKRALTAHVLTHIKSDGTEAVPAKPSKRPEIIVDDDLRVVSGAAHTGEAAQLTTARLNGARILRGKRDSDGVETTFTLAKAAVQSKAQANGAVNGHVAKANTVPSNGTIDNPGSYILDVTRTPTVGNEENLSPQGPAYTSILILRMLARRAASLLQKAGSKRREQSEDDEDAAAIRGEGDEKFGLPLPANFGSSDRSKRPENGSDNVTANGLEAGGMSALGNEEEDYETTEAWAVEAATRLLDAVEGVEEELMQHSSQNDILSSYINDTLVELRRRPSDDRAGSSQGRIDPQLV